MIVDLKKGRTETTGGSRHFHNVERHKNDEALENSRRVAAETDTCTTKNTIPKSEYVTRR